MPNPSRRGFLTFVGAGAAAAAGAAALGASTAGALSAPAPADLTTSEDAGVPDGATGSLVAYVHDVRNGQVAVMVDGHETVITDHALVAKLARSAAAARA